MFKYIVLFFLLISLSGCSGMLSGKVSTESYHELYPNQSFIVFNSKKLSLTERRLTSHIEKKMQENGYVKAESLNSAYAAVFYQYSIGQGKTVVRSSRGSDDKMKIQSSTQYPRFFQIVIIDLKKSDLPDDLEIIWQGELRSSGSSSDISEIGPYFIDTLFDNYGNDVTNKRFFKTIE